MPKEITKWNRGVGGIKCSCCREGTLSEAKRGFHRAIRRKVKAWLTSLNARNTE